MRAAGFIEQIEGKLVPPLLRLILLHCTSVPSCWRLTMNNRAIQTSKEDKTSPQWEGSKSWHAKPYTAVRDDESSVHKIPQLGICFRWRRLNSPLMMCSASGCFESVCVCVCGHMTIGHADHKPKCDELSLIILTKSQLRSHTAPNAQLMPHSSKRLPWNSCTAFVAFDKH